MANLILQYSIGFVVAFLVTFLITPYCRKLAFRFNMVDKPDEIRRLHQEKTPRNGGIAIFLGFHAACAVTLLVPWPEGTSIGADLWAKIAIVSTAIFALGLTDDIKPFSPLIKLAGQCLVVVAAFFLGFRMESILGYQLPVFLDFVLTMGWMLVIMNAFNLIDGMDGLATGLSLIAVVGLCFGLFLQGNTRFVLLMLPIAGACLAFLKFNFHPASIFLGDSGSLLLGFMIALLALISSAKSTAAVALAVPFFAVGLPLFDTILAVWRRSTRRLLNGEEENSQNPGVMTADKEHIHHRLLTAGLSQHQTAIILYAINLALIIAALSAIFYHSSANGIFVLSFVLGLYIIIRHLARIELWQTGQLISEGLKRPPKKGICTLMYPILDVIVLAVGFELALFLLEISDISILDIASMEILTPIWISIPFILLVFSGMYKRVWSRARLNDYFKLGCVLGAGILLASGVTFISANGETQKVILLLTVFNFLIVIPAIFFNRISLRLILELTAMSDRRHLCSTDCTRVLIYGAGAQAMSLLKESAHPDHESFESTHVAGFIDEDVNLWQRFVYGYKVHGGLDKLPDVVQKEKIDKVIITSEPSAETKHEILNLSEKFGFTVTQWVTGEEPVNDDL